jgi:hypothetical protein
MTYNRVVVVCHRTARISLFDYPTNDTYRRRVQQIDLVPSGRSTLNRSSVDLRTDYPDMLLVITHILFFLFQTLTAASVDVAVSASDDYEEKPPDSEVVAVEITQIR